jgi:hypothetical protein
MFCIDKERRAERPKILTLPGRSEVIVKLKIENGEKKAEGLISKLEIAEGIYVASSLTMIEGTKAITSILNTRETEVVVEVPTIKWEQYTPEDPRKEGRSTYVGAMSPIEVKTEKSRQEEVLRSLRLDRLNPEEKGVTENTCRDYQDMFYLPGDRLSSTNAIKHTINVVPGTAQSILGHIDCLKPRKPRWIGR